MAESTAALVLKLLTIMGQAQNQGGWTVVLCPSQAVLENVRISLAALLGGMPFSGRTAMFPGGHLSLACATEKVFIPEGVSFRIAKLGWEGSQALVGAEEWQKRASSGH